MIRIDRAIGLATVQAVRRRGLAWAGVPPGGPLVPEALAAANRRVGNPDGAAGIEVVGALWWDGPAGATADGPALELPPARAVRYLAFAGGIVDEDEIVCRPLRAGALLHLGAATGVPRDPGVLDLDGPIAIIAGPDRFPPGALDALLAAEWTVSRDSDRVGTRLDGPAIPGPDAKRWPSAPMVRGAIQVPPSGRPIVLGPDHPVTGGYPVIAVVRHARLGRIGSRLPGDRVRLSE